MSAGRPERSSLAFQTALWMKTGALSSSILKVGGIENSLSGSAVREVGAPKAVRVRTGAETVPRGRAGYARAVPCGGVSLQSCRLVRVTRRRRCKQAKPIGGFPFEAVLSASARILPSLPQRDKFSPAWLTLGTPPGARSTRRHPFASAAFLHLPRKLRCAPPRTGGVLTKLNPRVLTSPTRAIPPPI